MAQESQKHPITNGSDSNRIGSASDGIFICDASNPFDFSTLVNTNKGKMGFAIQLVSRDGSDVTIASANINGALGNNTFMVGSWQSGQGFALEIEQLAISGTGYAIIYLKATTENTQP